VPVKKKPVAGDTKHRIAVISPKAPPGTKSVAKPGVVSRPRAAAKSKAVSRPKGVSAPGPAARSKAARKPKSGPDHDMIPPRPSLKSVVVDALADLKALDVKVLDVRGLTDIADFMVIASGTSDRHVRSVAQRVVEKTKEAGFRPHGVEGQQDSDWVLIDLNEMIVHVMLPRVREFYGLEKLWDMTVTKRAARA
jgi:ribosome silencing factor RsfS/YbeB/iojap